MRRQGLPNADGPRPLHRAFRHNARTTPPAFATTTPQTPERNLSFNRLPRPTAGGGNDTSNRYISHPIRTLMLSVYPSEVQRVGKVGIDGGGRRLEHAGRKA